MKIINLRLYYPHYQQDKLVEVSEEVFDVLCQSVREMRNYERRKRYHRAYYSLDAFEWTENYALEHSLSPEQLVMLAEERAERDRLMATLREALVYATPTLVGTNSISFASACVESSLIPLSLLSPRSPLRRVTAGTPYASVCGLCNLRRYYADHPQGK